MKRALFHLVLFLIYFGSLLALMASADPNTDFPIPWTVPFAVMFLSGLYGASKAPRRRWQRIALPIAGILLTIIAVLGNNRWWGISWPMGFTATIIAIVGGMACLLQLTGRAFNEVEISKLTTETRPSIEEHPLFALVAMFILAASMISVNNLITSREWDWADQVTSRPFVTIEDGRLDPAVYSGHVNYLSEFGITSRIETEVEWVIPLTPIGCRYQVVKTPEVVGLMIWTTDGKRGWSCVKRRNEVLSNTELAAATILFTGINAQGQRVMLDSRQHRVDIAL